MKKARQYDRGNRCEWRHHVIYAPELCRCPGDVYGDQNYEPDERNNSKKAHPLQNRQVTAPMLTKGSQCGLKSIVHLRPFPFTQAGSKATAEPGVTFDDGRCLLPWALSGTEDALLGFSFVQKSIDQGTRVKARVFGQRHRGGYQKGG